MTSLDRTKGWSICDRCHQEDRYQIIYTTADQVEDVLRHFSNCWSGSVHTIQRLDIDPTGWHRFMIVWDQRKKI